MVFSLERGAKQFMGAFGFTWQYLRGVVYRELQRVTHNEMAEQYISMDIVLRHRFAYKCERGQRLVLVFRAVGKYTMV